MKIIKNFVKGLDDYTLNFLNSGNKKNFIYFIMRGASFSFDANMFAFTMSVFVIFLYMFSIKSREPMLILALSQIITHILKRIFVRDRPFVSSQNINLKTKPPKDKFSFPSGHTAAAFSLAFAIKVSFPAFFIPALILAILCGTSRVYLGVHYPTDVIIGALISTIVYYIVIGVSI